MPKVNCCVPACICSSRRTPNLTFYPLPKDKTRKLEWDAACKNSNLKKDSKWTCVCSMHFTGGYKKDETENPTIFPWSREWKEVIANYNASLERWNSIETCNVKPLELPDEKHLPRMYTTNRSATVNSRSTASITKRELAMTKAKEQPQSCEDDSFEVSQQNNSDDEVQATNQPEKKVARVHYYNHTSLNHTDEMQTLLSEILCCLEDEANDSLSREELLKLLTTVTKLLKSVKEQYDSIVFLREWDRFLLRRFEGSDDEIRFWTGFYSSSTLMSFYSTLLEPHVRVIKYWGSNNTSTKNDDADKCGPKRFLQPIDEMFLTLVKLKQGSANEDLAERFKLSASEVSRMFITWVNFMYTVLKAIDIWMSKGKIKRNMPDCFKGLYSDVRVIIDCTEIPLEKPSDFECQAATYSTYKHCNTVKALVGISPSGVPTFISAAFEGSISDNEITLKSGLVEKLERNDAVMADRGFTGRELLAKHNIRLVTPHFLSGKSQMTIPKLVESVAIARVRIHVERCMGRIKQWHILQHKVPLTYWKQISRIFELCTRLVLFWPPLLESE